MIENKQKMDKNEPKKGKMAGVELEPCAVGAEFSLYSGDFVP